MMSVSLEGRNAVLVSRIYTAHAFYYLFDMNGIICHALYIQRSNLRQ